MDVSSINFLFKSLHFHFFPLSKANYTKSVRYFNNIYVTPAFTLSSRFPNNCLFHHLRNCLMLLNFIRKLYILSETRECHDHSYNRLTKIIATQSITRSLHSNYISRTLPWIAAATVIQSPPPLSLWLMLDKQTTLVAQRRWYRGVNRNGLLHHELQRWEQAIGNWENPSLILWVIKTSVYVLAYLFRVLSWIWKISKQMNGLDLLWGREIDGGDLDLNYLLLRIRDFLKCCKTENWSYANNAF